jgi:PAS domain S-box-containing protein
VSTEPMHDAQGAYAGALRMVIDITERKRSEDALRSNEQQLRLILASTGEGIFGIDKRGQCIFANRACAQMLGYAEEGALLGQRMHRLTHHTRADGSPYPVEACPTYETCRSAKHTRVEGELLWRADGSAFPTDYQSHAMLQEGRVVGAVVTFSDMTERLEAREALRRERDFAESLIATAPVIILVLDLEGRIVRFNPFMAELAGYRLEEVQGKDWFTTFLPKRERARIQAVFQNAISDTPTRGNMNPILTRTGHERLISWHDKTLKDANGEFIGLLAIGHDVTAEKEREAQLFQAQKMEVMGRLTGGIAHDFNNLLTVILGNLELIKEQLPDEGLLRGFAVDALSAAQDGAALTQRLLGFARKTPLQPTTLALAEFLSQCQRLLRRMLREAIALKVHCDASVPPLYIDRAQLESALLNLAINAQDAMPEGGELGISAKRLEIGPEGRTDYPTLAPGDYALIRMRDTGAGMSPEQLARATEPFYTTKAAGQGSGLGLSMVYSFAKDSGGTLRLRSELGHGTTVELILPSTSRGGARQLMMASQSERPHGTGTILLVEDDARVRKLAKQYLTGSGYTVVEAETGDAALTVINSGTIPDLLFSDIALPGSLDGYALACRLAQDYPGVKVLLTTGADTDKRATFELDAGRFPLLRKPYSAMALAEAAKRLLKPTSG